MTRTDNLRKSYKWINFTQFLDRKNGGIKIVVTQKFCNLRVIGHYLENCVFLTMAMGSLI